MPRRAEGGGVEIRGKLYARVMAAPKQREAVLVPKCTTLEEASERGRRMQALIDRLWETGHERGIEKLIETAAPLDAAGMRKFEGFVERVAVGKEPPPWDLPALIVDGETFEAFAMKWVRGELAELYPDHVDRSAAPRRTSATCASTSSLLSRTGPSHRSPSTTTSA
jgi:hypothetical protein